VHDARYVAGMARAAASRGNEGAEQGGGVKGGQESNNGEYTRKKVAVGQKMKTKTEPGGEK
jgi:hypothetical protein